MPFMLFCVVLAGAISASGEVTVTGAVIGLDEAPVIGLRVRAKDVETVTDDAGRFRMDGLPEGEVLIHLFGEAGQGKVKAFLEGESISLILTYPVLTTIVLLHDNDLHFNYNSLESFSERIKTIRAQYTNVYLLSAGDMFIRHADRWERPHDTQYYQDRCAYMIATMNSIGYDACTPGNHEFYYIENYTRRALDQAKFPLLGANMVLDTDNVPPLDPYVVFETDNQLTVAVLGLTRCTPGREGVEMRDTIETTRSYEYLAHEHDLLVALTHIGFSEDRKLAEAMPEADVIIGGHSHHVLESGEWVNGVLLAMAGGPPSGQRHQVNPDWPKYLGKITIVMANDRLVSKTAELISFSEIEAPVAAE